MQGSREEQTPGKHYFLSHKNYVLLKQF